MPKESAPDVRGHLQDLRIENRYLRLQLRRAKARARRRKQR